MADSNGPSPALSPADLEPVLDLEARLGVTFADRATALAALTHKSYVNEHRAGGLADNERLEFLGDAVIDLAVSHRLMERFPGAREGDLSKMRAAVVDEQGLAAMARELDLGALLRLGRGEELTGGRRKASLLADAMEAVVAAVYLGDGLDGVLALVDRFLGEAFARAAAGTLDRDYKTQLQEQAQSRLRATPRYRVVAELGPDHAKIFEVEVDLRGEVLGRGAGRSKKDAEQAAAKLAIEALGRRVAAEPPAGRVPTAAPTAEPTPAPAEAVEVVDVEAEPVEPEVATAPPAEPPGKAAPPSRRRVPKKKAAAKAPARAAKAKPARKAAKPARTRQADRS
ncbi:MAG TPA: ribonuclease III [Anaeromyxobacteraceae bacterium]|nr:ribonuclease III [Anaeromyxobacteraceae bacterium]